MQKTKRRKIDEHKKRAWMRITMTDDDDLATEHKLLDSPNQSRLHRIWTAESLGPNRCTKQNRYWIPTQRSRARSGREARSGGARSQKVNRWKRGKRQRYQKHAKRTWEDCTEMGKRQRERERDMEPENSKQEQEEKMMSCQIWYVEQINENEKIRSAKWVHTDTCKQKGNTHRFSCCPCSGVPFTCSLKSQWLICRFPQRNKEEGKSCWWRWVVQTHTKVVLIDWVAIAEQAKNETEYRREEKKRQRRVVARNQSRRASLCFCVSYLIWFPAACSFAFSRAKRCGRSWHSERLERKEEYEPERASMSSANNLTQEKARMNDREWMKGERKTKNGITRRAANEPKHLHAAPKLSSQYFFIWEGEKAK